MASIFVLVIILGCAALMYLKSTFVKSFFTVIISIISVAAAFGYFELLAGFLIEKNKLVPLAQPICFAVLFIVTFSILQTIAQQITRKPVDFGFMPEAIGRIICGIFLGLIVSGTLVTALVMAPLSNNLPYKRFDMEGKTKKVLLNADGFVTGWFGLLSKGPLSGQESFAAIHPQFLNETFLNRFNTANGVKAVTAEPGLNLLKEAAAWPAPENIRDAQNPKVTIEPKSGNNLIVVRAGISKKAYSAGDSKFAFCQLSIVCKNQSDTKDPLKGNGEVYYPIGYFTTKTTVQKVKLTEYMALKAADFDGQIAWLDLVFDITANSVPVMVKFKQNNIKRIPKLLNADQAVEIKPYLKEDVKKDEDKTDNTETDNSGD